MPNVYPLPGYATVMLTEDGEQIAVRPLGHEDARVLLAFFRRVPPEDRFYLREDVTTTAVIDRWVEEMDVQRAIPLVALSKDRIVEGATLHRRRAGARRHIGEVRVVVDPEHRNRGIARGLLRHIIDIARDQKPEELIMEVVSDREEAALRTSGSLEFVPIARLPGHARDKKVHRMTLSSWSLT
ncbi:MAG: GNAT family N-acetyltransferase [Dehalococcoidia bacterium]|nr:GNAT family N-acetyltransferase [Dehalococcoidia bacterium]